MLSNIKLSAVVITYMKKTILPNDRIALPVADEIVVIDSNSTDRTKEICNVIKYVLLSSHF
jgi:glycosyltransferase involved in cell wall biosynthesis